MSSSKNTLFIILAFFSIYVIWGSTYLLNKIAVGELPPFMLASIRFMTAGIIIFIIVKLMGKSLAITKKQIVNIFIAGFFDSYIQQKRDTIACVPLKYYFK